MVNISTDMIRVLKRLTRFTMIASLRSQSTLTARDEAEGACAHQCLVYEHQALQRIPSISLFIIYRIGLTVNPNILIPSCGSL